MTSPAWPVTPGGVAPSGWQTALVPVRLLVLEDDDGIRVSLAMALEDEGYETTTYAASAAA